MEIRVFDVGHGFLGDVVTDNYEHIFLDCGQDLRNRISPSSYLRKIGAKKIKHLIISNYDEDHLNGLSGLIENRVPIENVFYNDTISWDQLREVKLEKGNGKLGSGMKSFLELVEGMKKRYEYDLYDYELSGISIKNFYNSYDWFKGDKNAENNISLVTFLEFEGLVFCYPGDLEKMGWRRLLEKIEFREWLGKTQFFVASHHGRENGFAEEVFDYCDKVELIIISDEEIKFESQEHNYEQFPKGRTINGQNRKVLSTRKDQGIAIRRKNGATSVKINCHF